MFIFFVMAQIQLCPFKNLSLPRYKPGYRPDFIGEESPDSTEQCTGEEPGGCHPELVEGDNQQTVPQKITSPPNPLSTLWRGGARSERVKM